MFRKNRSKVFINMPDMNTLHQMYRDIFTIRRFEEVGMAMYNKGKIRGYFHTCTGEEAIAVGVCKTLRLEDYISSTHRGHGHCIAKGADINKMMADLFGKATGYSNGRGGSMHIADKLTGNIGANGIVGAGIPLAVGVGMGIKIEKSDKVVACFFGDGASNTGLFAESINLAAVNTLPVIFVLENNSFAATTHVSETARSENLYLRADAYGVPGKHIFGNDPLEIFSSTKTAVDKARKGLGPTLLEATTYRHHGHHVNDPGTYMPADISDEWKAHDPLQIMRTHLEEYGVSENVISCIEEEVETSLMEAVAFAEESPQPDVGEFLEDIKKYDI